MAPDAGERENTMLALQLADYETAGNTTKKNKSKAEQIKGKCYICMSLCLIKICCLDIGILALDAQDVTF
jgi:hypothetical protein